MISSNQCSDTTGKKRTITLAVIRIVSKMKLTIVTTFSAFRTSLSTNANEFIIFPIASPIAP